MRTGHAGGKLAWQHANRCRHHSGLHCYQREKLRKKTRRSGRTCSSAVNRLLWDLWEQWLRLVHAVKCSISSLRTENTHVNPKCLLCAANKCLDNSLLLFFCLFASTTDEVTLWDDFYFAFFFEKLIVHHFISHNAGYQYLRMHVQDW